jgi:uncharacterized protein YbcI
VSSTDPSAGEVARLISNEAVKVMAEYTGRGPTKARTTISGRWVFITLEDTLTKGERQLAAHGHDEWVLDTRNRYQRIMRKELEATVERHLGRKVVAFMSDNHIDPDTGIEAFMLEPNGDTVAAADAAFAASSD